MRAAPRALVRPHASKPSGKFFLETISWSGHGFGRRSLENYLEPKQVTRHTADQDCGWYIRPS